ncbi:MAG TPA: septal ring lytic transglycosylase RlpA family protein [Limnobacter sp.]|uniref:septal ring lytic transglycosylase RlpA family protein n=1 Tax=Limnobacter sp. TaxID=2003368 RepID=UPI002EDA0E96
MQFSRVFCVPVRWPAGALAAVVVLSLSACSSVPLKPATTAKNTPAGPGAGSTPPKGWEAAPKGGGYYLDDGPADWRPSNLADLPMADPQVEPILVAKTKPYEALGQTFYPQTTLEEPYKARGRASWYGRKFHGARTATGEIYDMHQMTAAHPTLPLPSYAKVTNLSNGKWVIVRVNDRGPFLRNRVIDLSYAAAYKLDYISHGSAEVLVEKLTPTDIAAYKADLASGKIAQSGQGPNPSASASALADAGVAVQPVSTATTKPSTATTAGRPVYLQVGAFGNRASAESLLSRVNASGADVSASGRILSESGMHRVLLGPFSSLDQANEAAIQLTSVIEVKPVIKQDLILP